MSKLLKLLIPNAKTLAGYAADGIQKGVNNYAADKKETVAKYAALATTAAELAASLTKMLEDGTIDTAERDQLQSVTTPLFEKVLDLI